nr:flavodoxin family protein [uncultured Niameybacter sp.]
MKRVVAINGSKRKENTYGVIKKIEKILNDKNIEVEIINLFDYEIKDCIGCVKCIEKENCVYKERDEVTKIMEKLEGCDGIILATPVYLRNISGKLKTFIDRTCVWYHRPTLYGKPILCIATTAGSGLKATLNYLEDVVKQWAAVPAGRIGVSLRTINNDIESKTLKQFIKFIEEGTSTYKPSLSTLMDYQVQKVLAMKILQSDKAYWVQQGWDKSTFFIDCRIHIGKRILANGFYKLLSTVIKPQKQ